MDSPLPSDDDDHMFGPSHPPRRPPAKRSRFLLRGGAAGATERERSQGRGMATRRPPQPPLPTRDIMPCNRTASKPPGPGKAGRGSRDEREEGPPQWRSLEEDLPPARPTGVAAVGPATPQNPSSSIRDPYQPGAFHDAAPPGGQRGRSA